MNRRKSVVQPSGGLGSSEKKHRSPFAPFKRGDSAREMPIPESATFGEDRPNTAAPTQDNVNEPVRVTTESLDRRGSETEPQPAGTTANGMPTQESHGDIGFASPNTSEVCDNGHIHCLWILTGGIAATR